DTRKAETEDIPKHDKQKEKHRDEMQAENLRKMFISMSDDIRVILIKIADRLHNMRTLKFMPDVKQKEKAQETLDIYSPLAHRLGIAKIRIELEDLSFRYLYPEDFYDLSEKISRKQSERLDYINRLVEDLQSKLSQTGIESFVEGRPKHFFSIYRKMKSQNKTLDQIFDLFAIRIIVNENINCYEVLGFIHDMFTPMPGRFKEYIANPKPNGYQSLHTAIIGPEGYPVEIQIRTWDMHRISEYGIAAHWRYKAGVDGSASQNSEDEKLEWLKRLMEVQKETANNNEYLSTVKDELNVFADKIYCFTPLGQIVTLLRDSTPIDFAYMIHSAIGNKMTGARVNGAIVKFDHKLQNSDMVEILTSQNSKGPSPDWLKIVKTSQARNKINQWFRKENKEENIAKGLELLEKSAHSKGLHLNEISTPERKKIVLGKFNLHEWDALLASVGRGALKEGRVISRFADEIAKENAKNAPPEIHIKPERPIDNNIERAKNSVISVRGVTDLGVRFSKCCGPVPGDEIIGFITRGRGISIHRTDCVNIIHLGEIDRQRLIEAEWELPDKQADGVKYRADLRLFCQNRARLMNDISMVPVKLEISMVYFSGRIVKGEAIIDLGIEISSKKQLDKVTAELRKVHGVFEIERSTV
ncbi:MAG: bifunctional (p)ppGpp synthetase/guanosine-3',5'-bis(diphosphate) 3'-pyrophosphohydrolase, partial [Defluviitaleaceae bacterium]|nr:bifunctional (p)ppGpp synthetase/guanosine-3',5'-bis(diphosphate) 3'-pyrophosphohydrolase [Defluviitaleaceae bacterium]